LNFQILLQVKRFEATTRSPVYAAFSATLKVPVLALWLVTSWLFSLHCMLKVRLLWLFDSSF
jgi:hypothetical protein